MEFRVEIFILRVKWKVWLNAQFLEAGFNLLRSILILIDWFLAWWNLRIRLVYLWIIPLRRWRLGITNLKTVILFLLFCDFVLLVPVILIIHLVFLYPIGIRINVEPRLLNFDLLLSDIEISGFWITLVCIWILLDISHFGLYIGRKTFLLFKPSTWLFYPIWRSCWLVGQIIFFRVRVRN